MSSSLEERAISEGFVPDIFQILSCILTEDSFQSIPASGEHQRLVPLLSVAGGNFCKEREERFAHLCAMSWNQELPV